MMVTTTYLRVMRLKFGISLLELEQHCSFNQTFPHVHISLDSD